MSSCVSSVSVGFALLRVNPSHVNPYGCVRYLLSGVSLYFWWAVLLNSLALYSFRWRILSVWLVAWCSSVSYRLKRKFGATYSVPDFLYGFRLCVVVYFTTGLWPGLLFRRLMASFSFLFVCLMCLIFQHCSFGSLVRRLSPHLLELEFYRCSLQVTCTFFETFPSSLFVHCWVSLPMTGLVISFLAGVTAFCVFTFRSVSQWPRRFGEVPLSTVFLFTCIWLQFENTTGWDLEFL